MTFKRIIPTGVTIPTPSRHRWPRVGQHATEPSAKPVDVGGATASAGPAPRNVAPEERDFRGTPDSRTKARQAVRGRPLARGDETSPSRLRDTARTGASAPPEHGRESRSRPPVVDGRLLAQPTFKTGTRAIISQGREGRTDTSCSSIEPLPAVPAAQRGRPWWHIATYASGVRATCRRSPLPPTACRCLPSLLGPRPPRSRGQPRPP